MEEMCVSMVGRERETQLLLSYVKGDTDKAAEGSTEEPFASKVSKALMLRQNPK